MESNHEHDCNESENISSYFNCASRASRASCPALRRVLTKYKADKRSVTNMRGRCLQVPGDISRFIQDRESCADRGTAQPVNARP